jgi:glycosyltransferase involved in cell wall biosynthesis
MNMESSLSPVLVPARVLLVGAYPPPIGGNSVHIQRLRDRLRALGVEVRVLDYLGGDRGAAPDGVERLPSGFLARLLALVRYGRAVAPGTLVHLHVSALGRFKWVAPLLLWLFRRQARVITLHSGSFVAQASRLPRGYLRWLFKAFEAVIPVNDGQRDFLSALGVPAERMRRIPAYLPARPAAGAMPPALAARAGGKAIIVTSGDLTPIYQYAPLLDAAEGLDPERHLVVLALYGRSEPAYAEAILRRAATMPHVVVLRDQAPETFVSLLAASAVYVRPTTTDGDSVAVREALALGRAVVASDAVPRPAGCLTFALSDPAALRSALRTALADRQLDRPGVSGATEVPDENFTAILRAYALAGRGPGAGSSSASLPAHAHP